MGQIVFGISAPSFQPGIETHSVNPPIIYKGILEENVATEEQNEL